MSDGFTVDSSRSLGGVVTDGLDPAIDVDFVPETQPWLSGSWVGFYDEEYGHGTEGFTYKVRRRSDARPHTYICILCTKWQRVLRQRALSPR